MNRRILVAALVAGGMLGLAGPASAQFYPGYGYGGWGGTNGAAALLGSDYRQAAAMQLKAQSMQAGQQAAMSQNYVVQSGIRNTLVQPGPEPEQMRSRTSSRRTRTGGSSSSAANGPAAGHGVCHGASPIPHGFAPAGGPPPAAMDIIKWPTVLQEQCFASERTQIEAPYRRTPPKLSVPTRGRLSQDGRHRRGHEGRAGVAAERRHSIRPTTTRPRLFLARLGGEVATRAQAAGTAN